MPATAAVQIPVTGTATRIDRYAHGIIKKKGMAGRHLDLDIAARATRTCALSCPATGQGTTVTGHLAARTSRTASDPASRWPNLAEAPTTMASALNSEAIRCSPARESP